MSPTSASTLRSDRAIVPFMPSRLLSAAAALALLGLSGPVVAQPAEGGSPPIESLAQELGVRKTELSQQLQAGDCAAACEALASMQRAAERICSLEPGPRCEGAKRDVEEARQRVNAACPDCVEARREGKEVDANEESSDPERDRLELEEGELQAADEDQAPAPGAMPSAPPAEDSRGGCAACAVDGSRRADREAVGWLALGAIAWLARRRRSRRRG